MPRTRKVTFQERPTIEEPPPRAAIPARDAQATEFPLGGGDLGHGREWNGLGHGGYEGASHFDREVARWRASLGSPDRIINYAKDTLDARATDSVRNNGYVTGAAQVHQDSIVGAHFRLNAMPNWRVLSNYNKGYDEAWAEEFTMWAEAWFNSASESEDCWFDASRNETFTGLIRLAVAVYLATGETLATCEWIRESNRPFNSCVQFVRSDRLCNPMGVIDTRTLRRGVEMDLQGKPLAYYIRLGERFDTYPDDFAWRWKRVLARKPWGRRQVVHIRNTKDIGQTRGVADMVSVLKSIRMTGKFRDIVLQSAVINATYAAAIESELPGEAIAAAMGQQSANGPINGMMGAYGGYMSVLSQYFAGASNIGIDGAKIPHLFPNTKLNIRNTGTPGGIGTSFDDALLRHIAAGLGVSYESLSRDFSKTNYSSGRLAMGLQDMAMSSRKKHMADRLASEIYALWLEEAMANGDAPLPARASREDFYLPMAKDAFRRARWIGSGMGQIDPLKETQGAILRIRAGLSTHEIECARLGYDYREIASQRSREVVMFQDANVPIDYISQKPMDKPTDVPQDAPTDDSAQEADGETDEGGSPDDPEPSKGQSQ
jgi:lambda family phage portal protein